VALPVRVQTAMHDMETLGFSIPKKAKISKSAGKFTFLHIWHFCHYIFSVFNDVHFVLITRFLFFSYLSKNFKNTPRICCFINLFVYILIYLLPPQIHYNFNTKKQISWGITYNIWNINNYLQLTCRYMYYMSFAIKTELCVVITKALM